MWRFGIILNPDGAYNLDIKHDKSASTKPKTQLSITFINNCKQIFHEKVLRCCYQIGAISVTFWKLSSNIKGIPEILLSWKYWGWRRYLIYLSLARYWTGLPVNIAVITLSSNENTNLKIHNRILIFYNLILLNTHSYCILVTNVDWV